MILDLMLDICVGFVVLFFGTFLAIGAYIFCREFAKDREVRFRTLFISMGIALCAFVGFLFRWLTT